MTDLTVRQTDAGSASLLDHHLDSASSDVLVDDDGHVRHMRHFRHWLIRPASVVVPGGAFAKIFPLGETCVLWGGSVAGMHESTRIPEKWPIFRGKGPLETRLPQSWARVPFPHSMWGATDRTGSALQHCEQPLQYRHPQDQTVNGVTLIW